MSFLAPLFLLGSLAVALPVVFHLIRRTTRNRTVFSSLLFLEPTPPRLSRRSKLEHLLLLLLRCAVICLIALAFARPFFNKPLSALPASVPRRVLVLVDTSASMRRPNLWADARNKVQSLVAETSPLDQLAVFTFDRQAQPLVTFEQWKTTPATERAALVSAKLAAISPGWSSTHLGNALLTVAEALADPNSSTPSGPAQLYLITDLQEGSHLDGLQGYEWPKNLTVSVEVLKPKRVGNASIQAMTDSGDNTASDKAGVRLRVSNTADAPREQFSVGWANSGGSTFIDKPATVYVPPGQSRIVRLPLTTNITGANRVLLQGDQQDFDNSQFVLPLRTSQVDVLYLGSETEKDSKAPLYFLQRAFQQTRQQTVRVIARTPTDSVQPGELQSASLLIVADPVSPENTRALHEQVTTGKTALVCLKSPAAAASIAGFLGIDNLALEEANADRYAMLADIDFRHPLFASFADPRFSDFTKIHFWKHRHLDASQIPAAHVVARFDNGDPAVLDVPVGKGRVLILTSGWQPEDSQLALSSKFVPLLYAVLDQTGGAKGSPLQFNVGDVITLISSSAPVAQTPDSLRVRLPDGSEFKLPPGETNFSKTSMPGVYTIISSQPPREFAVNLEPSESSTAPLSTDELERLGVPLSHGTPSVISERQRQVRLQTVEMEQQQKLWRWIIAATLCMLLLETWLAGRTARFRPAQAQLGKEGAT